MKTRKTLWGAVAAALLVAGLVRATETVDQGMPGNQGAWPVSIAGSSSSVVQTQPRTCAATSVHSNTTVGGTSAAVPAAAAASRIYINVCNSAQNVSTAIVKCRADGTAPTFAAGNAGDVLLFGDCVLYAAATATTINCIADAAGRNVTAFECIPP